MATKNPIKKFKRYDEGGPVEESVAKKRGLDSSNKEAPVGFLERIRAGNIDDPSSEAYKRFGAGRGRTTSPSATTAENKSQIVPRIPPSPRMPAPNEESGKMQNLISAGSDFSSRSQDEGYRPNAGTASERAMLEGAFDSGKITENTSPRTKPSKPAIVTKEQMAKEGFDNLRDYLNAKQGLKRRKEKDSTPKLIDAKNIRSDVRFDDEGLIDPKNIRSGAGMKSGGSVSSASRRADGIATKGKTRGKIC